VSSSKGEPSPRFSAFSKASSPTSPSAAGRSGGILTSERVLLDAWAWWEILHDTATGRRLSQRYVESVESQVITVDLALAEISTKMARLGRPEKIAVCLGNMEAASEVTPITRDVAEAAGPLLVELRTVDHEASMADAVMLAAARTVGATLISADPAYEGQPNVRST